MSDLLPMELRPKNTSLTRMVVPPSPPSSGLRDVVVLLFRHRHKMLVFFLTTMLIAGALALNTPDKYTSQASLLVRRGRETSLDPTTINQILPLWKNWDYELNSEFEILNSRELKERVVMAVGIDAVRTHGKVRRPAAVAETNKVSAGTTPAGTNDGDPDTRRRLLDDAVRAMQGSLAIEVIKKSDILSISYTSSDRQLAQQVVAELVRAYLDKHIEVRRSRGTYVFFAEQAELCKQELHATETTLRNAKNDMGIGSLEGRRNINLSRIGALEERLETGSAKLAASKAKIESLKKMLEKRRSEDGKTQIRVGKENYSDIESALISETVNLVALQAEAQSITEQISSNLQVNSSRLRGFEMRLEEVDAAIASSKAKLGALQDVTSLRAADTNSLANVDFAGIRSALWLEETSVAAATAEAKVLSAQLQEAEQEVKKLNEYESSIRWLERKRDGLESKYRQYVDNVEQGRINQALEEEKISNITVIQPATEPLAANASYRLLTLLIGLCVGAFGSVGVAFASHAIDNTISRPDDLHRKLPLRTLAAIPVLSGHEISPLQPKHRARGEHASSGVRGGWDVPHEARTHFDNLYYRLLLSMDGHRQTPTVIGLTSCHGGEGVSSVAANLALTMARHASSNGVLLIDGNGSAGSSPATTGLKATTGATEIKLDAKGELAVLEQKLYMLHDEDTTPVASTISYDDVLRLVRKRDVDFAVVDIAPISEDIPPLQLASMTDFVILVVEAEKVRWQTVQKTYEQLAEAGVNVVGVVLNKRRFHVPGWLYRRL